MNEYETESYSSESFDEPYDEDGDVTDLCCHRREESEDDVDHHRTPNDPFGRKHFCHSTAGQLSENVAPEISAEYKALNWLGPFKRPFILCTSFNLTIYATQPNVLNE